MVLQLVLVALILGLYWRKPRMNQQEQDAIKRLEGEIGNLNTAHEAQRAELKAKDATIADLTAQLKAAQSDPAEVVDAVNALTDKVDAELAKDAPTAPDAPPAS